MIFVAFPGFFFAWPSVPFVVDVVVDVVAKRKKVKLPNDQKITTDAEGFRFLFSFFFFLYEK